MCTVRRIPDPSRLSYCRFDPSESRPLWSGATNREVWAPYGWSPNWLFPVDNGA